MSLPRTQPGVSASASSVSLGDLQLGNGSVEIPRPSLESLSAVETASQRGPPICGCASRFVRHCCTCCAWWRRDSRWLEGTYTGESDADAEATAGLLRAEEHIADDETVDRATTPQRRAEQRGLRQTVAEPSGADSCEGVRREHHRTYGPPRPRSLSSPAEDSVPQRAAVIAGGGRPGSASSASVTACTSEASSTLSRSADPTQGSEQWVMQRGVLMHIGPDGIAREATDSQTRRMPRPAQRGAHGGRRASRGEGGGANSSGSKFRTEDPADDDLCGGPSDEAPSKRAPAAPAAASSSVQASSAATAPTTTDALDNLRELIYTVDQLSLFLDRCAAYLPVRVEAEVEPGQAPKLSEHGVRAPGIPGPCRYVLHILGPLRPSEHSDAFGVLEDVILDDCSDAHLRLSGIHFSDLRLGTSGSGACYLPGDPRHPGACEVPSSDSLTARRSAARELGLFQRRDENTARSDAVSSSTNSAGTGDYCNASLGTPHDSGLPARSVPLPSLCPSASATSPHLQQQPQLAKECERRLLAFVKNLFENKSRTVDFLHFTRCFFSPLDMGRALPLPLMSLRQLLFEQCPLAPVHLTVLVQLARAANHGGQQSRSGACAAALGQLTELQLSGTLTDDSVGDVLTYLAEDATPPTAKPALQILRLPASLVRSAKEHPFVKSHPYVQVLAAR